MNSIVYMLGGIGIIFIQTALCALFKNASFIYMLGIFGLTIFFMAILWFLMKLCNLAESIREWIKISIFLELFEEKHQRDARFEELQRMLCGEDKF